MVAEDVIKRKLHIQDNLDYGYQHRLAITFLYEEEAVAASSPDTNVKPMGHRK